jgi:hypothetical protein
MLSTKDLRKFADRIRLFWESQEECDPERPFLECVAREHLWLQGIRVRLFKARSHGLSLVLPALRQDLLLRVEELRDTLDGLRAHLVELPVPRTPSAASLVADLRELDGEFGQLKLHGRQQAVSVTTEGITLEGMHLGPFVIKFFWNREPEMGAACFDIIALEPNSPAGNENITHPHVKDESLCAGKAVNAIRKALEGGRLADAFLLIRSVLRTYNPNSAHVTLDSWEASECPDCGQRLAYDDDWTCEECGSSVCVDCITSCKSCDTRRCASCIHNCVVCFQPICDKCLRRSAHSKRPCCCPCLIACKRCTRLIAKDEIDNPRGCAALSHSNPTPPRTENFDESECTVTAPAC